MAAPSNSESDAGLDVLQSLMGDNFDREIARKALSKYNGDVERAADALLTGDVSPSYSDNIAGSTTHRGDTQGQTQNLAPSLAEARYGPSEQPPEYHAPLNVDHGLEQAIQASLNDLVSDDDDRLPPKSYVREGERPIAIHPDHPGLTYAALLIQALFYVPQVRDVVSQLNPVKIPDLSIVPGHPDLALPHLLELFVHLDLAKLAYCVDKEVLPSLGAQPWDGHSSTIGDSSVAFFQSLNSLLNYYIETQAFPRTPGAPRYRLFDFLGASAEYRNGASSPLQHREISFFNLEINPEDGLPNDLLGRLSAAVVQNTADSSAYDVIIEPSQVVVFHIKRTGNPTHPTSFHFPDHMYMDQFLANNLSLSLEKRKEREEIGKEIINLQSRKAALVPQHTNETSLRNDHLQDLDIAINYYEHHLLIPHDEKQARISRQCLAEMKTIMSRLRREVEVINSDLARLRNIEAAAFDVPELKQLKYDLRAVLVSAGLPGRKNTYSYVRDFANRWWKTVDYDVTEVSEETVISDSTGIHLNAGPYMLIYSRNIPDQNLNRPRTWPRPFVERIEQHNQAFLSSLPPSLASKVVRQ